MDNQNYKKQNDTCLKLNSIEPAIIEPAIIEQAIIEPASIDPASIDPAINKSYNEESLDFEPEAEESLVYGRPEAEESLVYDRPEAEFG